MENIVRFSLWFLRSPSTVVGEYGSNRQACSWGSKLRPSALVCLPSVFWVTFFFYKNELPCGVTFVLLLCSYDPEILIYLCFKKLGLGVLGLQLCAITPSFEIIPFQQLFEVRPGSIVGTSLGSIESTEQST